MSVFTLAGEDISVYSYSGFDLPDDVTATPILSDESSTHNEVLQSSGPQMPKATLNGRTADSEVIALLRSLRASHEEVVLVEPDGIHVVVVLTLSVSAATPATFLREWSMTLAETGSGVGSGS